MISIETSQNAAKVSLDEGDAFYFKPVILNGITEFDWCFAPPHGLGSPIMRIIHRWYVGMRRVTAADQGKSVCVTGYHARGNFHVLNIVKGARFYVNARNVAGFCGQTSSIRTKIKFQIPYWCFQEHFFTVFYGPATVLLYSKSGLVKSTDLEFSPRRIVAFDINRAFQPAAPQTTTLVSGAWNLVSDQIIWKFTEPGVTVAESYHPDEEGAKPLNIREIILHLIALLKI